MARTRKKLLSILLTLAMVIGMLPGITLTAGATGSTVTTPLDFTNMGGNDSGDGWAWDENTSTLTLDGADIQVPESANSLYAIKLPDGATVNTVGDSTVVNVGDENRDIYGIYGEGSVNFTGTAELSVTGGPGNEVKGVYCVGDVTVSGNLTAFGRGGYGYGVYANSVTLNGGSLTARGNRYGNSIGIYVTGGTVTVNGGVLTARGAYHATFDNNGYKQAQLQTGAGATVMSGSCVSAVARDITDYSSPQRITDDPEYLLVFFGPWYELGGVELPDGTRAGDLDAGNSTGTLSGETVTFAGWYEDVTLQTPHTGSFADSTIYYAKWTKNGVPVITIPLNLTAMGDANGDGWAWDNGTSTLTLNGANILVPESEESQYAIWLPDGATVNVTGNSTVVNEGWNDGNESCGIYTEGSLTFSGTAELTVHSGGTGLSEGVYANNNTTYTVTVKDSVALISVGGAGYGSYGLYARCNLVVRDRATLQAEGADTEVDGAESCGLNVDGRLTVMNDATLTATTGSACYTYGIMVFNEFMVQDNAVVTVTAGDAEGYSYGVQASDYSNNSGTTVQDDATLTVTAGDVTAPQYGSSYGFHAQETTGILVTGNGTMTATGGEVIGADGYSIGLSHAIFPQQWGQTGAVEISGNGTLTAVGGQVVGSNGESEGIWNENSPLRVTGGTVKAFADAAENISYGIYNAVGVEVTDGTLTAEGAEMALYENGTLKTNSGIVVLSGLCEAGAAEDTTDYTTTARRVADNPKYLHATSGPAFVRGGVEIAAGTQARDLEVGGTGTVCGETVTFAGWYTDAGYQNAHTGGFADGTIYYAKWTQNGLTVVTTPLDFGDSAAVISDVPEGSHITWDATNKIFTLDGAKVLVSKCANASFAIQLPYGTTVKTIGDSTVFNGGGGDGEYSYGIYGEEDLTFAGPGTLTVTASEVEYYSYAIYAYDGKLDILSGATVIATAAAAYESVGVYSEDDVNVYGHLTATAGDSAGYANSKSLGVLACCDVNVCSGGTLIARAGSATDCSCGIALYDNDPGKAVVDGGTLIAEGETGAVYYYEDDYAAYLKVTAGGTVMSGPSENTTTPDNTDYTTAQLVANNPKYLRVTFPASFELGGVTIPVGTAPENLVAGSSAGTVCGEQVIFAGWYTDAGYQNAHTGSSFASGAVYYAKWEFADGEVIITTPLDFTGAGAPTFAADTGITWNQTTSTLTLDGAKVLIPASANSQFAIKLPGGAAVNVIGDSTVVNEGKDSGNNGSIGIYADGSLTVGGTNRLTVRSGGTYYSYGIYTGSYGSINDTLTVEENVTLIAESGEGVMVGYGLYTNGNLVVRNHASLQAEGADTDNDNGESYGLHVYGNLTVRNDATLTATSGSAKYYTYGIIAYNDFVVQDNAVVTATAGDGECSYGVEIWGNNNNSNTVTVQDNAVLTATGSNLTQGSGCESYGIYAIGVPGIYVKDHGTLTAAGGDITCVNSESMGLYHSISGMTGVIEVSGNGTLTATGGKVAGAGGESEGILSYNSSIRVTGGTVKAFADAADSSYGINTYTGTEVVEVTDGTLTAEGAGMALSANGTLKTSSGAIVTSGASAAGAVEDNTNYTTAQPVAGSPKYLCVTYPPVFELGGVEIPAGTQAKDLTVGASSGTVCGETVTFAGWYEDAGFSGSPVTDPQNGTTYYAKWTSADGKAVLTAPMDFSAMGNASGEGWVWDSVTNTLILDGVKILVPASANSRFAVRLPDGATVNTIAAAAVVNESSDGTDSFGIDGDGSLTFGGTAELTATGSAQNAIKSAGIQAAGSSISFADSLTVLSGATVTAISGDTDISYGILMSGDVIVDGNLTALGGDAAIISRGINAAGVTVNKGSLKAYGRSEAVYGAATVTLPTDTSLNVTVKAGVDEASAAVVTAYGGEEFFSVVCTPKSSGGKSSGSSGSSVTVPVTGKETVQVKAVLSGRTASVQEITAQDISKVTKNGTTNVKIDLSALPGTVNEAKLTNQTVKNLADSDSVLSAEIILTNASVKLDSKTLDALSAQVGNSDLLLHCDVIGTAALGSSQRKALENLTSPVLTDTYFTCNGKRITDFKGGSAVITTGYTLPSGKTAAQVVGWYLDDNAGLSRVECSYANGKASITAPHFSYYVISADGEAEGCTGGAGCPSGAFSDLDTGKWYHKAVDYVLENGLMSGYGSGKFGPDDTLNRAMLVTILWRQAGAPVVNYAMDFSDVSADAWYAEAVRWAASQGIVAGYDNGKFGSEDSITREQLATILYRYEQKMNDGGFQGSWMFNLDFTDADQISDWASEAMHWCVMNGILSGTGNGILAPRGTATRAQAAQMLMKYLTK